MNHDAIRAVHPNAYIIDDGEGVFDIDGNKVEIDEVAVAAKAIELKTNAQVVTNVRQSALNKLMALGLTEEEALALGAK